MGPHRRNNGWRYAVAGVVALGCALTTSAPAVAQSTRRGTGGEAATKGAAIALTDKGFVRGEIGADYRSFQGIPYAAQPEKNLRWKNPQPAPRWAGVRDATKPGPRCAQPAQGGIPASDHEDCLNLNVITPRTSSLRPRPVMVWVHGGGFTSGAGSEYDPRRMVNRGDVVVVTVNYRLGIFGNFAMAGLPGAGNFGLADQQAALRWVRGNAASFGGDPRNVTLFGESAGGMSTCALLTSPRARGLFDKAIIESGSCSLNWPAGGWFPGMPPFAVYSPVRQSQEFGAQTAKSAGCGVGTAGVSCLRGKTVAELLAAKEPYNAPAYGTPMLPAKPADALRAGTFMKVPVINGHNRDEHQGNAAAVGEISATRYAEMMRDSFGSQADAVLRRYPAKAYSSPAEAWGTAMTDRGWACPAMSDDRALSARTTTYAFEFADRTAPQIIPRPKGSQFGAVHAAELPYLFAIGVKLSPTQTKLSDTMIDYWTRFARTSNPNSSSTPPWSPVVGTQASPYVQELNVGANGVGRVDQVTRHQCAFWSTIKE